MKVRGLGIVSGKPSSNHLLLTSLLCTGLVGCEPDYIAHHKNLTNWILAPDSPYTVDFVISGDSAVGMAAAEKHVLKN